MKTEDILRELNNLLDEENKNPKPNTGSGTMWNRVLESVIGKIEEQRDTIKRLEEELAKEKFYSKKYEDEANKLCLSYEGTCKQLQEQKQYVKALEYAINKQRNSNLKLCMFKDLGMCVLTHNWIPIIQWYRNEVNNEADVEERR